MEKGTPFLEKEPGFGENEGLFVGKRDGSGGLLKPQALK
jgi:hypothetical protein